MYFGVLVTGRWGVLGPFGVRNTVEVENKFEVVHVPKQTGLFWMW